MRNMEGPGRDGLAALLMVVIGLTLAVCFPGMLEGCTDEATAQAVDVATVYDTPAKNAEPRTDGPIYDLPDNVHQQIVCDRQNREYLLLTTARGGVCLVPFLDEDGEQAVMPNA